MAGVDAFGTSFRRGDGGTPETFTAIASVTDISAPGLARDTIDTTAHDTPDKWREFIGALKDGGEVSFDINYNPNVHDTLLADFDDVTPRSYRIVFPTTPQRTWTIKAIMTGFEPSAPVDDKLSASLSFKVSGKPTFA
jgi:predicted secreted protein